MPRKTRFHLSDDESIITYLKEQSREEDLGYETPCWTWQGASRKHKSTGRVYGCLCNTEIGGTIASHRLAGWVSVRFPDHPTWRPFNIHGDPTIEVHHKCSNSLCVNPAHMQVCSSRKEHILAERKLGNRSTHTKLNENAVILARVLRDNGATYSEIAEFLGCCMQNIHRICSGQTWQGVGNVL